MSLTLTEKAELASRKLKVEPQLVLEIDGVTTYFGAVEISRYIRIGDEGLVIGNDWRIGGLTPIADQVDNISLEGTSTEISQQLQPDKGSVSSVSSVTLALTDRNLVMTRLISPGVVVDEILGRKATLWMGFKNTAFKEDYVKLFTGVIDDVVSGPGVVKLNVAHPEQLKRQIIFRPVNIELASTINNLVTTIPLVSTAGLPVPVLGPDGVTYDDTIRYYVRIEDEIIRYTGVSGNNLTGCTRGELGTLDVSHTVTDDPIAGQSLITLEDISMNLALKVMLSGKNGPWATGVAITRYLNPDAFTTIANSIFFSGVDLNRDYGLTEGDFVTITGATNGANNCVAKQVEEIVVTDDGSYAVISGVSFVAESETSAVVSFRSQFDTLGQGLAMAPDQVDVDEHIYWSNFLLASFSYRFIIQEEVNGKDFLDKQIYLPIGAYSLPRKGRVSVGYHVGPVVRGSLKVLSRDNVKDPHRIQLRRTINRNFYNSVVYKFDKNPISGSFNSGSVTLSSTSQNRIPVGARPLVIESEGLRRDLGGTSTAERGAERYLGRYALAAEFFEAVSVLFRDGAMIEPGDVVLFNTEGLRISNTADGTRDKPAKTYTVMNTRLNLKTGDVQLALTDTNFDEGERYGGVSPSSQIVSGTTTSLMIEDSYGDLFPGNEYKKWETYVGLPVLVHSPDWSFAEEVTLQSVDAANKYKLNIDPATPLSAPPGAGYIVEVGTYPTGTDRATNAVLKAELAFMGASVAVTAGASVTQFTVSLADVGKFQVGGNVRVRNADFSSDSGDVEISAVDTGTGQITVASSLGFTPTTSHIAEALDFADGAPTYRVF